MYFFGLFSLRHSVLNLNFIWGKSYWEDLHLEDQDNLHMHLKETTPPPPLCCLTHASLGEIAVSEKKKKIAAVCDHCTHRKGVGEKIPSHGPGIPPPALCCLC